ncbi:T9SS type A sorting domain-containing protein [Myroides sp. JBRI-B21084]|uniref:T9SS type A sorting domain-containing protein n=1 Tax=Myroides sp. JBRI-B21084 TaxID=3119977 RepID=UPI0026E1A5B9|nr:T9SS type A sorting domain-containing protein [Paenimyroides cloacae]WKW47069.1 T9SS type A sorting domain-containing protein [Paenimyroides cloacae]
MKKIYTLITLVAATLVANAQATLPVYEPYNYTAPGALQTQTGYTAMNSGDDVAIVAGNLTYTNLPASTGNKVNFAGSGIDTKYDITLTNSNTIYYSFLVKVNNISAATDANGGYFGGFGDSTTAFGATVWTKRVDDNTFKFGSEVRTATAAGTTWTTSDYNVGETYLVVGSYTFVAGADNDVAKLWINPTLGTTTEPTATIEDQWTANGDLSQILHFFLRQDSPAETPDLDIDELRIGTSWADVTPIDNSASTKENSIEGLNIFPNPANDVLNITSNSTAEKNVQLFDLTGKKVLDVTTVSQINVSTLKAGIYVAKINEAGKTATRKVIIK